MSYLANVLATNPKAFYRLSDKGGPFRRVSPGDPAAEETGSYGGVYVLGTAFTPEHGDDLVTGHYPGMAYEAPGLQSCDADDGAFFYGTVLASEGVPPAAGEPQGCVQTTDPLPFSFHDRIPFSVVFSHAGCLGKRYEALHDYEIVLAGGIVGTQTAADDGGFRGWGCYTILDDTGIVPQYKLRFMRGNAGGLELVIPDTVVAGGGDGPGRMRNYCVYDGAFMTIYSDISIAEYLAGGRPFPWAARQGSTARSGTGAGLTIGSLDFNTVYSGYWANLEGRGSGDGGAVDDVIIYDRALDDDTVLYLDGCAGVVPFSPSGAVLIDGDVRATRSGASPAGLGGSPVDLSGGSFRAARSGAAPGDPTDQAAKAHLTEVRFRAGR